MLSSCTTNSKIGPCDDLLVWKTLSLSCSHGLKTVANPIICFKSGSGRRQEPPGAIFSYVLCLGPYTGSLFFFHTGIPLRRKRVPTKTRYLGQEARRRGTGGTNKRNSQGVDRRCFAAPSRALRLQPAKGIRFPVNLDSEVGICRRSYGWQSDGLPQGTVQERDRCLRLQVSESL